MIEILSLIIAILAVIIGPFITLYLNHKEMEFRFRTQVKETWVNKLEESAHLFLYNVNRVLEKYDPLIGQNEGFNELSMHEVLEQISSSSIKLRLLLDRTKSEEQDALCNIITGIDSILKRGRLDANSHSELKNDFISFEEKLQRIFHAERSKIANIFRKTLFGSKYG